MVRPALAVIAMLATPARAEVDARDHARHATVLYLSAPWSPGPTVPVRLGFEAALRFHGRGVAIEARLGVGAAATLTGLGSQLAGHAGGSVGHAFAVTRRLVVVPMLAYDVFAQWEHGGASFAVHYVTAEFALSILVAEHAVLEPFVQLGVARYHGATDPVIVAGPRIGIAF